MRDALVVAAALELHLKTVGHETGCIPDCVGPSSDDVIRARIAVRAIQPIIVEGIARGLEAAAGVEQITDSGRRWMKYAAELTRKLGAK